MKRARTNFYLAIDLGATSGRHVVGFREEDGHIDIKLVHRFKTGMDESSDGLVWAIPRIFNEIKIGIKKAFELYDNIVSLSIDTWGVDYVLMNGDKEIPPFYAYRNERCEKSAQKVHKIINFEDIYRRTGIQYASFNTLYQLYDDKLKGRLDNATDYLMLPSYFTYKLTGKKTHEYTNESTGALLDAKTKEYDYELLSQLGLPKKLFKRIEKPGLLVGNLTRDIQKEVGGNTKVILCASHDTASAFEGMSNSEESIYISSGTWSLLGVKNKEPIITEVALKANYTNEGGVGYIRFLKNIMGMWINNRARDELNLKQEFINEHVASSTYKETFDVNDSSLLAPTNMHDAVYALLKNNLPKDNIDLFASIYRSLALAYKKAIDELEVITNKKYKRILIFGGGANNKFLNEMVKEYTKLEVIPIPAEMTGIGNIIVQMKGNNDYEKRN